VTDPYWNKGNASLSPLYEFLYTPQYTTPIIHKIKLDLMHYKQLQAAKGQVKK
jgi:hypothetical protein